MFHKYKDMRMTPNLSIAHGDFVTSVLASAKFHDGARGIEQITLIVPLGNDKTHHMMILVNPDTKQIVIDVFCNGMINYSGVFAADMAKPMCPMFKQ